MKEQAFLDERMVQFHTKFSSLHTKLDTIWSSYYDYLIILYLDLLCRQSLKKQLDCWTLLVELLQFMHATMTFAVIIIR